MIGRDPKATRSAALLLSSKLLAAEARVQQLEQENDSLRRHNQLLTAALQTMELTKPALAPEETS